MTPGCFYRGAEGPAFCILIPACPPAEFLLTAELIHFLCQFFLEKPLYVLPAQEK